MLVQTLNTTNINESGVNYLLTFMSFNPSPWGCYCNHPLGKTTPFPAVFWL